jgi:predicted dinucleotide-binding enzyme
MEAWRRSDADINTTSEKHHELRNYRLRQYRPGSGESVCPQRHRSIGCNHARPGKLCIRRGRDRPTIIPKKLAEAVKADIVLLAVRFESHQDVAKALPTWQGKTIVDVTNAYGVSPEKLGGQPSSKAVAQAFAGGRLVKGFNHLAAAVLDQDPAVHGGRRVVFLASDDDDAAAEIGALAEDLGFAPIKLGRLSEGGLLVQARGNSWGQLIFKDLVKFD